MPGTTVQRKLVVICLMLAFIVATGCGPDEDTREDDGNDACINFAEVEPANGKMHLDGCYLVGANQQINVEDIAMTIEAGSRLVFDSDGGLSFTKGSSLVAKGTEANPIEFVGDQERAGFWRGVVFRNHTPSSLDHVVIRHAGSKPWHSTAKASQGGVVVRDNSVVLDIKNSEFIENDDAGLSVESARAEVSVAGSVFKKNSYPIRVQIEQVSYIAADNAFSENDKDVVLVIGGGDTVRDGSWAALEIPYLFDKPHSTISRAITISPGATLLFSSHSGLAINEGTLTANAEGADPIVFSGEIEKQGFWRGLRFMNTMSTENQLVNVEVRYGGSEKWHGTTSSRTHANVIVQMDSRVEIRDAVFTDSGGFGVTVGDITSPDGTITGCENITFENNLEGDWAVEDGAAGC